MPEKTNNTRHKPRMRNELKVTTSIVVLKPILEFATEVAALDGSSRNEVIQNTLLEYLPVYRNSVLQKLGKLAMKP